LILTVASKSVSLAALAAIVLPCLFFIGGAIDLDAVKWMALAGTVVWFIVTPQWMGKRTPEIIEKVESEQVRI